MWLHNIGDASGMLTLVGPIEVRLNLRRIPVVINTTKRGVGFGASSGSRTLA